ncbi:SigE family RNA polymerase sigma factor [Jatrophihabitans sp. DSM 45814]
MQTIEEFIDANSRSLLRSAWLLTGNWGSAEDLVQVALLRSWQHWDSIQADNPEVYVRKVLTNSFLTGQRRRWISERPVAVVPDRADADDLAATELRQPLRAALAALPPKQRAVVVLRYFNDYSEAQTAAVLGCSVGNVKSQASRAISKLRTAPGLHLLVEGVRND